MNDRTATEKDRDLNFAFQVTYLTSVVPEGDLVVLAGDFNTDVRGEPALNTLSAYFRTGAPWPLDGLGNGHTNANRSKHIDWILADDELVPLGAPVV